MVATKFLINKKRRKINSMEGDDMKGCLILHGFTGGPYEVEPLTTYLRERTNWNVVVPVLEGHGKELQLKDVTYEKWIKDAEDALMDLQKRCNEIYVIGFSMGGMIAAYLAAVYSVKKLVLLSTARRFISVKYLSHYFGEMIGDGLKGKLNENELFLHYKEKIGDIPLKANVEFVRLVNFTKQYLKDISIPVFIAQGKRDEMVPFKSAYILEEEIASENKEVVFFEQSDHLICLGNDKDVLNKLVLEFLMNEEMATSKLKEESIH